MNTGASVIGIWIMWWGAVMGVVGTLGGFSEQFLTVDFGDLPFYLISILSGVIGVVGYEMFRWLSSTMKWKRAGGDDRIRKVVLLGTLRAPHHWILWDITPSSSIFCTTVHFNPDFGIILLPEESDVLEIRFDSLLTIFLFRSKMDKFIAIRESLS